MIINGIWWLVISFSTLALLYLIAMTRKPLTASYPKHLNKHSTGQYAYSTTCASQNHPSSNGTNQTENRGLNALNPMNLFKKMKENKHLKARQGLKSSKQNNGSNNSDKNVKVDNIALQTLANNLEKQLPDYQIEMKKNHINIMKTNKKLLMITLDKNMDVCSRKLGGVTVVNFHNAPTHTDILTQLKNE